MISTWNEGNNTRAGPATMPGGDCYSGLPTTAVEGIGESQMVQAAAEATARILIVEGDGIIASRLQELVTRFGYNALGTVASGEEALQRTRGQRPDLVLSDIYLAGELNGIEMGAQIRAQFDVPVIYLTDHSDDALLQQAKNTEAYGYLVKPVQDTDIYAAIEMALYKHKLETELRKSEARFRGLFEHSNDAIFVHDLDGQILDANGRACEMLGYSYERLTSMRVSDLHPQEALSASGKALQTTRQQGQARFESQFIKAGGDIVDVEISARITDPEKGIVQGIVRDITERVRAEKTLQREKDFATSLVETAQAIVLVLDTEGRIVSFNPYMEEVSGYQLEQVQGKDWFTTFLPQDNHESIRDLFSQAVGKIQTRGNVNPIVTRDGRERLIEWYDKTLKDADGNVIGLLTIGQDITERVQAEKELRYQAFLLENVSDAIISSDMNFIIQSWNYAAEEVYGWRSDEVIGKSVGDVLQPTYLYEQREQVVEQFFADGHWKGEVIHRHKDGTSIHILGSVALLKDGEGNPLGVVSANRDISERVRAEEALRLSEARWRSLTESSPDRILTLDTDLNIQFANFASPGLTVEELIGTPLYTYAEKERQAEIKAILEGVLGTGEDASYETTYDTPDGGVIYYESRVTPRRLRGSDEIVGLTLSARDITARKQAVNEYTLLLAQVREQVQRVQQIVDTVPEGVLLLDTGGRIVLANPLGRKDLDTLAGAKVGDVITHLGDRPLAKFLTSPPKGLWHDVDTSDKSFQIIARPLETNPEPEGWVLVIRDVTQQREFEKRAQQQDRLAAVGQLAAGIAHDFNNIMAVITLHAGGMLRIGGLAPATHESIAIIDQQAWQASDLIQQILDFSRRAALERHPMDLLVLLKEQVKLLKRTLPESIGIDMAYSAGSYVVNADPTRMQQVIMNLAVNARDAMPERGQLHIGLEWTKELPPSIRSDKQVQRWVRITVTDTGTGIPPDVLPHIFDPFFTTKAPDQGTGLGLSQVYGIVTQHDGHIDVATEMGKGTTFTLYLPAFAADRPQALTQETQDLVQGQGQTILVVEDNDVTRKALMDALKMLDYRVLEAGNGREALAILENGHGQHIDDFSSLNAPVISKQEIALVLSDVTMPEMGGQALFQTLRQRNSDVKVVLMTGNPLQEELESLRAQGLSGWLLKPPKLEKLSQMMARALEEG